MKTKTTGGRYDYTRRAFRNVEEMAYFLGRSPSYVRGRLTGGAEFTDRELEYLNKAVSFYDHVDIYPVTFQKTQKRNKDETIKFVFSMVWLMTGAGAGLKESAEKAREVAATIYPKVPTSGELIDMLYEMTDY